MRNTKPGSGSAELDALLEQLAGYKMDAWERRAQAIDWSVGNVMCMRNGHLHDEWMLRKVAAEQWEATRPAPTR